MAGHGGLNDPPGGRPPIEINQKEFERVCRLNPTLVEVAGVFECSDDTIERWCVKTYGIGFAECLNRLSSSVKIAIRREQLRIALERQQDDDIKWKALTYCGKHVVGQRDSMETVISGEIIARHEAGKVIERYADILLAAATQAKQVEQAIDVTPESVDAEKVS